MSATLKPIEIDNATLRIRTLGFWGGILVCFAVLLSDAPAGLSDNGWKVVAFASLMAIWWMSEALPVAVTALVPLIAIPLLNLGDIEQAAQGFSNKAIYLTLGGFALGVALERWNLHRRIALHTVRYMGNTAQQVVGGFMLATGFISMWITNTATTVMMFPIALSVAELLMASEHGSARDRRNFGICLMLGLSYASSMGGLTTLVGTSTNVLFKGFVEQELGVQIGFGQWLMVGLPIGASMLLVMWWGLTRVLFPCRLQADANVRSMLDEQIQAMGPMCSGAKRTLWLFLVTALLWIFGQPLEKALAPMQITDASVAIAAMMALFIIPSGTGKGIKLLSWGDTRDLPWGIILLLGGGLSMAEYVSSSGVADWLGAQTGALHGIPPWVLVLIVSAVIVMLSELMSNVATLTAFLPVALAVATSMQVDALPFLLPLAFAASCGFMLPVATPPNAIVYGSGLLPIRAMIRSGFVFNIIGVLIINAVCALLVPLVFG